MHVAHVHADPPVLEWHQCNEGVELGGGILIKRAPAANGTFDFNEVFL